MRSRVPWQVEREPAGAGTRYRIRRGATPLSFRAVFELLERSAAFVDWYAQTIAAAPAEAFFWEHPPLTEARLDDEAELVLIPSDSLARLHPDPSAFTAHFDREPERDVLPEVVVFPNLAGDALLVVPRPLGPVSAYPHLAAFLREAPARQVRALLQTTGKLVREHGGAGPLWLSVAGLGVPWLHVRLDDAPKYYRHDPYRRVA